MEIDERFLTVHPRTALWWEQRPKCEACVNSHTNGDTTNGLRKNDTAGEGLRCTAAKAPARWRPIEAYCIDAREPGTPCGPDALLFKAAS